MTEASRIRWSWWNSKKCTKALDRRRTMLRGPRWPGNQQQALTEPACAYPEVVALAEILAAPELRRLPAIGSLLDLRRFINEVRARVAPGYQPTP
ncbi:hypothetical protein ACWDRB_67085 [Nonomuraea sp. NPDC003707]